jgi:anti-sigma factor RsiW
MSAYLDNDLAGRARARLERHVADCPECRRILRTLRRMLGLLGEAAAQPAGEAPDITAAVIRRLAEQARE